MSCAPCTSISQKIIYFRQNYNNQESVQICFIALSHRYITLVFADKKGKFHPPGSYSLSNFIQKNLRHVRLNQWKLVFMIKGGILRRKVIEFERKRKRKVLVYLEAGGGIIGLTNTNLSAWHLSQSIGMSCYNNWSKATLFLLRLRPHATPRLLILKNTPTKKWLCIVERNR